MLMRRTSGARGRPRQYSWSAGHARANPEDRGRSQRSGAEIRTRDL